MIEDDFQQPDVQYTTLCTVLDDVDIEWRMYRNGNGKFEIGSRLVDSEKRFDHRATVAGPADRTADRLFIYLATMSSKLMGLDARASNVIQLPLRGGFK